MKINFYFYENNTLPVKTLNNLPLQTFEKYYILWEHIVS